MNTAKNMTKTTLSMLLCLGLACAWAAETKPSAADNQAHAKAITDAIAAVTSVKDAVANYRLHHDAFPVSNAEAGVLPPAAFASSALKRVEVGKNGMIEATLTAESGVDDGVIRFVPAKAPQTDLNQIDWTCTTPSYSTISDISNCTYGKNP
jgi:hypothetical protein